MNASEPCRATWLQNLVITTLVVASFGFAGNLGDVGKEVTGHLGNGAAGWIVYVAVLLTGALIVLAAITVAAPRFKGPGPRPTVGEICASLLIVCIVGVFGFTLGDNLQGEVRMQMSGSHWVSGTLGFWPKMQGTIGWLLATFTFLGLWATVAQVAERCCQRGKNAGD